MAGPGYSAIAPIILMWKNKYKQTFAITCSFIINKLYMTDLSRHPTCSLMNKAGHFFSFACNFPFLGSGSLLWILPSE